MKEDEKFEMILMNQCFNCGEDISSDRLIKGFPCSKDIENYEIIKNKDDIYNLLVRNGRLFNYKHIYELEKISEEFISFFRNKIKSNPWTVQVTWFKRLFRNESFTIIAPTGIGKSTFISVAAAFMSKKFNKKILIIVPTRILSKQYVERINSFNENINVYYLKSKKDFNENYDILVITNNFLSKNFDVLKGKIFDYIFVDDVDAFFKGSKNIEKVMYLLGFSEEDIKIVNEYINSLIRKNFEKIGELKGKIEEIKNKRKGSLILSSASGNPRGKRIIYYKVLLDFNIGTSATKLRNIEDVYVEIDKDIKEKVLELVKVLKNGILIFVPKYRGTKYLEELYNYLLSNNIRVGKVISKEKDSLENIEKFYNGELDALIGIADSYSILARGIDFPTKIKYAIFVGLPVIYINLTNIEKNLNSIIILGNLLSKHAEDENVREKVKRELKILKKLIKYQSSYGLKSILESLENENIELSKEQIKIRNILLDLYNIIKNNMNEKVIERFKNDDEIIIDYKDGNIFLKVLDFKTYIQASGRTSRLYAGGLSKGISFILEKDEKLLKLLDRRLSYIM